MPPFSLDDQTSPIARFKAQPAVGPAPAVPQVSMPFGGPSFPIARPTFPSVQAPKINVVPTQPEADMNRLNELKAQPDGISQVHNPWARGSLRVLDTALRVVAPRIEQFIPGTSGNRDYQIQRQQGIVGNDQQIAKNEQGIRSDQAQEAEARARAASIPQQQEEQRRLTDAQIKNYESEANLREHPRDEYDHISTDEGLFTINKRTGEVSAAQFQGKQIMPKSDLKYETVMGPDGKPHTYGIDKQGNKKVDLGEHYERPITVNTGTWTPGFDKDKNPVMFNSRTGEVRSMSGDFSRKPGENMTTADKNRASLATIAMANLDQVQDIINRRPDLLGKMGAVKTTADLFGSDDPDLVALGNEVHNFAMANAGIHGSRSFQNVQAAEQELLGHFKNGAKGIQGGINANRKNLEAVINPSSGNTKPAVGAVEQGHRFKGGDPADPKNWEAVK